MIDSDLHHRAYLSDLLAQQEYLTTQAERLRSLLDDTEARLAQNADLIAYMETVICKELPTGIKRT